MGISVSASGPLFDGTAEKAIRDFRLAAERDIAEVGVGLVKDRLHSVLKHPTGRYESRIGISKDNLITDGGIVYGPWLEGVSSRNTKTRFKGYSTFRRVKQELQVKAAEIAEKTLQNYIDGMR
jgi:hypothetical protein